MALNDRRKLAPRLNAEVFRSVTFADLNRRNTPDIWINATDLYHHIPLLFTPPALLALCSELSVHPAASQVAVTCPHSPYQ